MEVPTFLKLLKLLYNGFSVKWGDYTLVMSDDLQICVVGNNGIEEVLLPIIYSDNPIGAIDKIAKEIGDTELTIQLTLLHRHKKIAG